MTLKCNTTHVSWGLETQPTLHEWLRDGAGWNERELVPRISPACSLHVWFLQNGLIFVSWHPFQPSRPSSIIVSSLLPSQFPPFGINFCFLPITAAGVPASLILFIIVSQLFDFEMTVLIFCCFPNFSYRSICLRYFAKSVYHPYFIYLIFPLYLLTCKNVL